MSLQINSALFPTGRQRHSVRWLQRIWTSRAASEAPNMYGEWTRKEPTNQGRCPPKWPCGGKYHKLSLSWNDHWYLEYLASTINRKNMEIPWWNLGLTKYLYGDNHRDYVVYSDYQLCFWWILIRENSERRLRAMPMILQLCLPSYMEINGKVVDITKTCAFCHPRTVVTTAKMWFWPKNRWGMWSWWRLNEGKEMHKWSGGISKKYSEQTYKPL